MITFPLEHRLDGSSRAMRLDAALAVLFPELGLRARRRLWGWCRISVNGRERPPGFLVEPGDCLRLEAREPSRRPEAPEVTAGTGGIALVALNHDYAALAKPRGLHSAHVAASPEPSLEILLPGLWAELYSHWNPEPDIAPSAPPPPFFLLTRLDKATSGLILAARHEAAARQFRLEEARGLVRKRYLALLRGNLEGALRLTGKLLVEGRSRTGVSDETEPDPARHTLARPLARAGFAAGSLVFDPDRGPYSLALVEIRRGARHQIRAHLAGAGFPLCGEWLYAPRDGTEAQGLFLHHAAFKAPGFAAVSLPDWLGALAEKAALELCRS